MPGATNLPVLAGLCRGSQTPYRFEPRFIAILERIGLDE